jgi:hypothetical protein
VTWTRTGGVVVAAAPGTIPSASLGSTVAVGDFIGCVLDLETTGSATDAVVDDTALGNVFTRRAAASSGSDFERMEIWTCIVTVAGTPTLRVRFNPTPGTSATPQIDAMFDAFTGSDASSTIRGTPAVQLQTAPGTGADQVSSGSLGTATSGDLVYGGSVISSLGTAVPTLGTGFSLGGITTFAVTKTEYKTSSGGTEAVTFQDATNGGSARYLTAGVLITPAAGGGGPTVGGADEAGWAPAGSGNPTWGVNLW